MSIETANEFPSEDREHVLLALKHWRTMATNPRPSVQAEAWREIDGLLDKLNELDRPASPFQLVAVTYVPVEEGTEEPF